MCNLKFFCGTSVHVCPKISVCNAFGCGSEIMDGVLIKKSMQDEVYPTFVTLHGSELSYVSEDNREIIVEWCDSFLQSYGIGLCEVLLSQDTFIFISAYLKN